MTVVVIILFILIVMQQIRICIMQTALMSIIDSFKIIEKNSNLIVRMDILRNACEDFEKDDA